jgi:hypothetical protein
MQNCSVDVREVYCLSMQSQVLIRAEKYTHYLRVCCSCVGVILIKMSLVIMVKVNNWD